MTKFHVISSFFPWPIKPKINWFKDLFELFSYLYCDLYASRIKNVSFVKEFERLDTRIGTFTNEDYNNPNEENFCEKINKKYVF